MELRYVDAKPIVRCTKTERRHLGNARDSLRALAHVEPTAGELIEYLDGLVNRIDEEGFVQPQASDAGKPDPEASESPE